MANPTRMDRTATVLLVSCALVLTGLALRRELGRHNSSSSPPTAPERVDAWPEIEAGGWVLSEKKGKITLVEFSDFQCPYCKQFYFTLDSLMADYPDDLRVIYRHFPIQSIHPEARSAAVASECAGEQFRFSDYYDALFRNQGRLTARPWVALAAEVGLDTAQFKTCLASGAAEPRLAADSVLVARLRLSGTPSVIINGWMLPGTPTRQQVRDFIAQGSKP